MKKEKNTVEPLNDEYLLLPNIGVGKFRFRTPLTEYTTKYDIEKIIFDDETVAALEDLTDSYSCANPEINLDMDDEERICFIVCEKYLIWKDKNLLELSIQAFKKLAEVKEDKKEMMYLWKGYDQRHTVYSFNALGLMVWTYRNKILSISATDTLL